LVISPLVVSFYWDMQDVIGRIETTRPGGPIESANGNISSGKIYGVQLTGSYRLLPQVLLSGSVLARASSVTDPFTGESRRIPPNDRGFYTVGLRHDLPALRMNYGVNFRAGFQGNRPIYDIDKIDDIDQQEYLSFFVERTSISRLGLALRLEADNLLNDRPCTRRVRYQGRISSGIIEQIENRCTQRGRQFILSLRGNF